MKNDTKNKELENIKLDDEIIEKVDGGTTIKNTKVQSSERDENEDGKGQSGMHI